MYSHYLVGGGMRRQDAEQEANVNIRIGSFAAWLVIAGSMLMLGAPAVGLASISVETPQGHQKEDAVALSPSTEARLSLETTEKTAADAAAAAAATTGGPGEVGQWGPVVEWPVVAIHTALLPNGKVLAYDSIGDHATESYPEQTHTRATVWDPATGSQTDVTLSDGFNIFCSGLAHLTDGNLFIAGGNKNQALEGIVQTHYFDWENDSWSLGMNMASARWYPSVTPMGSGEMLITSGGPAIPEVRQTDGTLRQLSNASLSLPLYPWFDVAPDGRAFDSGPDQTMRSLNPSGTGAWQLWSSRDSINRDYGGHAMYDVGKILVAGGGPSTNTADVIDINGATPTVTPTGSMAYGRRQNNLTVLADGTALVTGGNSSGAGLVDLNAGVYPAELWSPATGQWTTLASMRETRQYHSTALLLPDGRVLSAGGGICGECDTVGYLAKNAEIFSPPYLFAKDGSGALAPRPTVTAAPGTVTEGTQFTVSTPEAASISKVALVRLGAVTHSNNMEQRYVPVPFTAASGTLTVTAPPSVNIAPPGYYMLFLVNSAGVPSVAPILSVLPPTRLLPPTVETKAASEVKQTTATLNATVNPNGGEVGECKLEYGTTTAYGSSAPCTPSPGSGSSPMAVSASVTSLAANTTYHFRITATNPGGNSKGSDQAVQTLPNPPTVVTAAASSITQMSATLNATVNPNEAEVSECTFEYGTTSAYGSSASCTLSPGLGTSPVAVSTSITGLSNNTTYHFRISSTNAGGASSGSDQTFTAATPHVYKNGVIEAGGNRLRMIGWGTIKLTNSTLGEVECHEIMASYLENQAGGGSAVGQVQALAPYECVSESCKALGGTYAEVTAEKLPWSTEVLQAGEGAFRIRTGNRIKSTGAVFLRDNCAGVKSTQFFAEEAPKFLNNGIAIGVGPEEVEFDQPGSGELESEALGGLKFSGKVKVEGYGTEELIEVKNP
jgi:Domain of unknown function (DUF1929)